jgi:DNA-binding PadR family transcriptional regulator
MEIMDEIENMTQGWWRPSPGSVYPMLDEMVRDSLVKKREDGKYELTAKTRNEDEWPFGSHFAGPRSVDDMLNEISGYVSYFEDMSKTDKSKLESYSEKIRTISDRLSALIK